VGKTIGASAAYAKEIYFMKKSLILTAALALAASFVMLTALVSRGRKVSGRYTGEETENGGFMAFYSQSLV
jgi:hypothetical protein